MARDREQPAEPAEQTEEHPEGAPEAAADGTDGLWGLEDIAKHWGISYRTVSRAQRNGQPGQLPKPDTYNNRRPYWLPDTIRKTTPLTEEPQPSRRYADPDAEYWDLRDVAAAMNCTYETARSYRARGRGELPEPDTYEGRSPRWRPQTIRDFQRIGTGYRTDIHGPRREFLSPTLEMTPWWVCEVRSTAAVLHALAYRRTAQAGDTATTNTEVVLTALDTIDTTATKALAGLVAEQPGTPLAPGTLGAPHAALEHIRSLASGALAGAPHVDTDGVVTVPGPPTALRAALDQIMAHQLYKQWQTRDEPPEEGSATSIGAWTTDTGTAISLPEGSAPERAGHTAMLELPYAVVPVLRQALADLTS